MPGISFHLVESHGIQIRSYIRQVFFTSVLSLEVCMKTYVVPRSQTLFSAFVTHGAAKILESPGVSATTKSKLPVVVYPSSEGPFAWST